MIELLQTKGMRGEKMTFSYEAACQTLFLWLVRWIGTRGRGTGDGGGTSIFFLISLGNLQTETLDSLWRCPCGQNHPSQSNKPFLSILTLYLCQSIAEYKVPEQIMARAASPESGSGIRMQSQWDLSGGDECSFFPLLIGSKSRQLSDEGWCVKALCDSLLMQLPCVFADRQEGLEWRV